jgi:hypothetical protein
MSVLSIVCSQVGVSAKGLSLVQRSPTVCDVCECDLETSTLRRPGPLRLLSHGGKVMFL